MTGARNRAGNPVGGRLILLMKTYLWIAENGKFRGAKTRHETTAGFRDFDKIEFRATETATDSIFAISPIPAKYPTIQTHATTATKILNGATIDDAKPARAKTGDGAKTATGRFSLKIENDALILRDDRDAIATAKIDRDGLLTLTAKTRENGATFSNIAPVDLLKRAHVIASDFVQNRRDAAIEPYIAKTATATAGRYSVDVKPDATETDARALLIRSVSADETATDDDWLSLKIVTITTTGARDFINWRDQNPAKPAKP